MTKDSVGISVHVGDRWLHVGLKSLVAARDAIKFTVVVTKILERLGAVASARGWTLPTIYGPLCVSVWSDAVMARFEDVAAARNHVDGINPHSGKWNLHGVGVGDAGAIEARFAALM